MGPWWRKTWKHQHVFGIDKCPLNGGISHEMIWNLLPALTSLDARCVQTNLGKPREGMFISQDFTLKSFKNPSGVSVFVFQQTMHDGCVLSFNLPIDLWLWGLQRMVRNRLIATSTFLFGCFAQKTAKQLLKPQLHFHFNNISAN